MKLLSPQFPETDCTFVCSGMLRGTQTFLEKFRLRYVRPIFYIQAKTLRTASEFR